jgi:EAL domain-containing protein (putative c-di-GMP-specific phosphodiesterase class I)
VRRLLAEGRVRVAFQPIWDLQRGSIVAFEALARPAPEYGFAGPQEAFDIAERIGHAHDLDAVCRQAILARAAELPSDTLLFLNVSPQTLDHDLLAGTTLAEAVMAVGLTPERVVLELTERSVARLQVVVREAARLHSLGFKLALDDTGAGNAGLEMLSQVPVDVVKIDRGVVVKALTDRAARGVLAGIIAIARETDTYVIAEGIEDQAMLDLVRRMGARGAGLQVGVQGVQGYLLGRPSETLPAQQTVETYRTLLNAA